MTWINRYRIRQYLNDRIWIGPCVAIVAGLVTARLGRALNTALGWEMNWDPGSAQTVLITLSASMFTFVVFVSSALLIALQLASAQLTPRIIGLVFRDAVMKWSMTLFVFTFTLALAVVLRVTSRGPALTVYLAAYSSVASLAVFLYLIDHIGKLLRPANALRLVAVHGRRVIESVYPVRFEDAVAPRGRAEGVNAAPRDAAPRVIVEASR